MNKKLSEVSVSVLEYSGYKARIMEAELLKGKHRHGLPPGMAIDCIPLACLPGCPENWVRQNGSYVVPVKADKGLWFDWTLNDEFTTAVIPSVKGMNPITGMKIESLAMEQYRDKCPIHDVSLTHGNFCEKCGFNFPHQNYVHGVGQKLWLDGFIQPDGTVRQFYFTEDELRDVASHVIGKENTVPAFGFAFYRYMKEVVRPVETYRTSGYFKCKSSPGAATKGTTTTDWGTVGSDWVPYDWKKCTLTISNPYKVKCMSLNSTVQESVCYSADTIKVLSEEEGRALRPQFYEQAQKEVSIGAGSLITQSVTVDMRPLEDYHKEPQAVMRIYFVFEPQLLEIVERGGIKKIESSTEGYLKGVPVGV